MGKWARRKCLRSAQSLVMRAIINSQGGRIIPAQGAIPVHQGGELVGAIGGTAQEDEDCVRKGLEAL